MDEEKGSLVGINDDNSSTASKESCFSKQKKIIIVSSFIALFILIIIIVIVFIPKFGDKKDDKDDKEEPYEPHFEGDILGKIECIHKIERINDYVLILGDKFEQNSIFDIQIEGKSVRFIKNYKFESIGEKNFIFVLYENINMENMFKDLPTLKTVKMSSDKNVKILSVVEAFENCTNLEKFEINVFNISLNILVNYY